MHLRNYCLTGSKVVLKSHRMAEQQPTSAPQEFIRLLEHGIRHSGLTKAEVAFKAEISPAYLSRLLNGERGVPADSIIVRLEAVLNIEPRGQLFDAAGRHDAVVGKVLQKEQGRVLMRNLAPLTDEDLGTVLSVAAALAKKYQTL
ncbi:MAG: helix-turn-helix transcriptional regulator [Verrucomicrobia bacterium]|nr:helix-turn-helix transcriptional regulator [Verrucomicrobiota bacterium]